MTDNKIQLNVIDRPELKKAEKAKREGGEEQARQSQSGLEAEPTQHTVPGRRPLFRN